jgi:hypothetical protein
VQPAPEQQQAEPLPAVAANQEPAAIGEPVAIAEDPAAVPVGDAVAQGDKMAVQFNGRTLLQAEGTGEEDWNSFNHVFSCDSDYCNNNGVCMMGKCSCDEGWTGEFCSEVVQTEFSKDCSSSCNVVQDSDVQFCKQLVGQTVCAEASQITELDKLALERANQSADGFNCFFRQLAVQCAILLPPCNSESKVEAMCIEECIQVHDDCDIDDLRSKLPTASATRCRAYAMTSSTTRAMIQCKKQKTVSRAMVGQEAKSESDIMGRCEMAAPEDMLSCPHLANKKVFVYSMFGSVRATTKFVLQQLRHSKEIGDCLYAEIAALCHSFLPVCDNAGSASIGMCKESCEEMLSPCKDMKAENVEGFCSKISNRFAAPAGAECHRITTSDIKGQTTVRAMEKMHQDIVRRSKSGRKGGKSSAWMWIALPTAGVVVVAVLVAAAVTVRRRRTGETQSEVAFIADV